MPRNRIDFTPDIDLIMKDAGAVAASAAATVGGVAQVIDFCTGAAAGSTVPRVDGRVIIDVTALTVAAGDLATICLQLSNTAACAGGLFNGGNLLLGDVTLNLQSLDTVVPLRQELCFTNEVNGVCYRYCRLWTQIAAAETINYTGWMVIDA